MSEKNAIDILIEQKFKSRVETILNPDISGSEFVSNLLDICTLNKLRDANEKNK